MRYWIYPKGRRKTIYCIKVDFTQAYDCVSWGYLRYMFRRLGFAPKWCRWMEALLFESSMSVIVNRSPTIYFKTQRGLRQVDPLSPFVFVIADEGLNGLVKIVIRYQTLRGFKVNEHESYNLFQFVDDTLLLGEALWENLWAIKSQLKGF